MILSETGISFSKWYIRIQWLPAQFGTIALICARLPEVFPTKYFCSISVDGNTMKKSK